jgi:hypothetical protein
MTNPWDILPRKQQGDAEISSIFEAVGAALTTWEKLDSARAYIFGALVNSRRGAAERAYGTVSSSAGRAEMVIEAAKAILPRNSELLADLLRLMTEIEKLSGRRNDIAHGMGTSYKTLRDGEETDNGAYLVPAPYNSRKFVIPKSMKDVSHVAGFYKYAYTADQIWTYQGHFAAYHEQAMDLFLRIHAHCMQQWPPQLSNVIKLKPSQQAARKTRNAPTPKRPPPPSPA